MEAEKRGQYDSVFEAAQPEEDYLKPRSCASTPVGIPLSRPPAAPPLRSEFSPAHHPPPNQT